MIQTHLDPRLQAQLRDVWAALTPAQRQILMTVVERTAGPDSAMVGVLTETGAALSADGSHAPSLAEEPSGSPQGTVSPLATEPAFTFRGRLETPAELLAEYAATRQERAAALLRRLEPTTPEDAAEQAETWAYLQRVLDEDRLSDRPLFP